MGKNLELIEIDCQQEFIPFSTKVQKVLEKENEHRSAIFSTGYTLKTQDAVLGEYSLLEKWRTENSSIPIVALSVYGVSLL